jgi:transposase-like protein
MRRAALWEHCVGIAFGSCFLYIGAFMNQTPGDTPAARERYWTRIIKEARLSPKGVKVHCAEKGISLPNYYSWFKRLRVKHPEWVDLNSPGGSGNRNGSSKPSEPDIEVVEKAVRRKFSATYKAKILREAEAASPGTVAAILRREGLYSSHLQKWRAEESRRAHEARKRGPKTNPLAAEVKRQREEIARLEQRLTKAGHIIELQKKIAEIMGVTLEEIPDDE